MSWCTRASIRDDADPFYLRRHGIYKWQQAQSHAPTKRRSLSFSGVQRESSLAIGLDPSLQHIHEPGGFRRQFVINRAVERGEEEPRVLRSFIDFLYLYGHFVRCPSTICRVPPLTRRSFPSGRPARISMKKTMNPTTRIFCLRTPLTRSLDNVTFVVSIRTANASMSGQLCSAPSAVAFLDRGCTSAARARVWGPKGMQMCGRQR